MAKPLRQRNPARDVRPLREGISARVKKINRAILESEGFTPEEAKAFADDKAKQAREKKQ